MSPNTRIVLDLITVVLLLGGMFFMSVAAIGIVRMPDLYHRIHAATKGVTLGIFGLLLAGAVALAALPETQFMMIATKVALVILFQFVANPVGAHLLAKAGHLDKAPLWSGTLGDELAENGPDAS
jgi:multicomponent Na+:H+ antiporter subunit G